MHQLTSIGKWRLKVRVKWDKYRFDGEFGWENRPDSRAGSYGESEWDDFKVGSEATNYTLGIGNQLSKDNWEGDPFHSHNLDGMQFSTRIVTMIGIVGATAHLIPIMEDGGTMIVLAFV